MLLTHSAGADVPPVPVPAGNPLTEEKRVLGKILFWEEQLSSDDTVACGTCHRPADGGADPRPADHPGPDGIFATPDDVVGSLGIAHLDANGVPVDDPLFGFEPQVTGRGSPSFIGGLWAPENFWDGRAEGVFVDSETQLVALPADGALESQAIGPIQRGPRAGCRAGTGGRDPGDAVPIAQRTPRIPWMTRIGLRCPWKPCCVSGHSVSKALRRNRSFSGAISPTTLIA